MKVVTIVTKRGHIFNKPLVNKSEETADPVDMQGAARKVYDSLGLTCDFEEFLMGMNEEMEHKDVTGGDLGETAKIAIAHLQEDPQYYSKLKASNIKKYGTSEGAQRAWDTRGRGQKEEGKEGLTGKDKEYHDEFERLAYEHSRGALSFDQFAGKIKELNQKHGIESEGLRRDAKFGDEVTFSRGGTEIRGTLTGKGEGGKFKVTDGEGKVHEAGKHELRSPKGGYKQRGE